MLKKIETAAAVFVLCCVAGSFGFVIYNLVKTAPQFDAISKSYDGLIMVGACSVFCRDSGGILMFGAPEYCHPKTIFGIKYSETCTRLTQCRCKDTRYFVECRMTSEVRKVCESDNGSVRETILE